MAPMACTLNHPASGNSVSQLGAVRFHPDTHYYYADQHDDCRHRCDEDYVCRTGWHVSSTTFRSVHLQPSTDKQIHCFAAFVALSASFIVCYNGSLYSHLRLSLYSHPRSYHTALTEIRVFPLLFLYEI